MEEQDADLHSLWEAASPDVGRTSARRSFARDAAETFFHPLSLLVLVALVYGCIQLSREPAPAVPNETPVWRSVSARGGDLRDAPAALKEDSLSALRKANLVEYGGPKRVAKGAEFEAAVAEALKSARKEGR